MRSRNALLVVVALFAGASAFGSGFALYEPSVISHAMGGALVGKAMDASANFNNPATLTDLTNIWVTVGFVTEHPRGSVSVRRNGSPKIDETMDPGFFMLPHFQLAVPLPWGFAFGLGGSADYGLGTQYGDNWMMNWNSTETDVQGYVLNPNLAYKIGDFSIAGGLRWLYFDFEQYKRPQAPYPTPYGVIDAGTFGYHLKGDNRFESTGWQVGAKYDILDNLSVGAVYKSAIDVDVRGDTDMSVRSVNVPAAGKALAASALQHTGSAEAGMRLPQSVTMGLNWDVVKTWHLGTAVSWTQWSNFDQLIFDVKPEPMPIELAWRDTWRASVGSCWDFWEGWKWMVSYAYDMDCTTDEQSSTMLPPANRHILATGLVWNIWRGFDLAVSYSCIFMDGGDMHTTDALGNRYDLETCWGFCHAAGASITYRF